MNKQRASLAGIVAGIILCIAGATALASVATADTRDPDLPGRPSNIADLFLADSKKNSDGAIGVDWFCKPGQPLNWDGQTWNQAGPYSRQGNKVCSGDSRQAVGWFNYAMYMHYGEGRPTLMRVGKARDDCVDDAAMANCGTGVPPTTSCPSWEATPYCAMTQMKSIWNIKLGVVMGSQNHINPDDSVEEDGATPRPGRSTKDMAWQACMINKADTAELYDFMFIDQADFLGGRIDDVVQRVTRGEVWDDATQQWQADPGCQQGWDVITNDNNWQNHTLNTLAWGHAKHYSVAESTQSLANAADGNKPPLAQNDVDFINTVNGIPMPPGKKTGAVMRVEVTPMTSNLAKISQARQCAILRRWAQKQDDFGTPFAGLYPIYNHGFVWSDGSKPATIPYDSYVEGTLVRQLDLMGNADVASTACGQQP